MSAYLVEFMEQNRVVRSVTVAATTPFRAAEKASGKKVTFDVYGTNWLQVTPSGLAPSKFGFVENVVSEAHLAMREASQYHTSGD